MSENKINAVESPLYTKGEEIFNMVSHIVGGALAIAAVTLCVIMAAIHSNVWGVVSGAIYGGSMVLLYTMSSLYHGLRHRTAKKVFRIIDHCSIFFLIAGTYTPYMLSGLRPYRPGLAWTIFGIIWGAAALGITLNAVNMKKFKVFSMICYLAMGWCVIFSIKPTFRALTFGGSAFLLIGGILYTVGALLYGVGKKKKYNVILMMNIIKNNASMRIEALFKVDITIIQHCTKSKFCAKRNRSKIYGRPPQVSYNMLIYQHF